MCDVTNSVFPIFFFLSLSLFVFLTIPFFSLSPTHTNTRTESDARRALVAAALQWALSASETLNWSMPLRSALVSSWPSTRHWRFARSPDHFFFASLNFISCIGTHRLPSWSGLIISSIVMFYSSRLFNIFCVVERKKERKILLSLVTPVVSLLSLSLSFFYFVTLRIFSPLDLGKGCLDVPERSQHSAKDRFVFLCVMWQISLHVRLLSVIHSHSSLGGTGVTHIRWESLSRPERSLKALSIINITVPYFSFPPPTANLKLIEAGFGERKKAWKAKNEVGVWVKTQFKTEKFSRRNYFI